MLKKIGPEGDVRLVGMIKEKIEERNKKIEEEKGLSKKQQRRLARRKEENKNNKIIEKVEELEGIESKEKESEIYVKQKEKNKDTDCLSKIPMGAEDSETQDRRCYSRDRENLLDEVNNRKVEDIEVKEIEIEIGNEQEEGLENKKVEYEGIEMEEMNEI